MSKIQHELNPVRLRSTREFREIYRSGHKITGRFFLLFLCPRDDDVVRFGVTATKRLGNAVVRNRAKRIMRQAIRNVSQHLSMGVDLIMVARPSIRSAKTPILEDHLIAKLRQNGYCLKSRVE